MNQKEINSKGPDWLKETKHKRVVLDLPGMDQIKTLKNLTYKQIPDQDLQADIYLPEERLSLGVIFVHGGYLPPDLLTQPKDWGVFTSYGQLLAASGFTAVTFNHRYYGIEFLETAQSDIKDLITFVRERGPEFGLDPSRLHLWAFSGGGPLIYWALRETPNYIRSLVLYYAILDMPKLEENPEIPEMARVNFSAVHQLENSENELPPIFIARAGLDRSNLNQSIDKFIQVGLKKNINIEFSNHPKGQHGFDLLDDVERSRQIIRRSIDFIKSNSNVEI